MKVIACTVLHTKMLENAFLESLGIFSVMLHAMHTQDISKCSQSLLNNLITVTVDQVTDM